MLADKCSIDEHVLQRRCSQSVEWKEGSSAGAQNRSHPGFVVPYGPLAVVNYREIGQTKHAYDVVR